LLSAEAKDCFVGLHDQISNSEAFQGNSVGCMKITIIIIFIFIMINLVLALVDFIVAGQKRVALKRAPAQG
jgi:hypothetical protein